MIDHPPAPWRMAGQALVVVAPMPLAVARALVAGRARALPLAVVILAHYAEGDPLRYGEVAGLVGVLQGIAPAGWVDSMLVDDERSMAGGRAIWNVPKELTRFSFEPGAAEAEGVLRATWRPPARLLSIPRAAGAFLGGLDGTVVRGTLRGRARLAPVHARIEIPPGSPLERLRLGRPRLALAGEVDLLASSQ